MKRRKFITYSAGSTCFLLGVDLISAQPANAFIFSLLRGFLVNSLARLFVRGAFSFVSSAYDQRSEEWFNRRLEAQLAQREFLSKNFTNVGAAELQDISYQYVVGAENFGAYGCTPAFSFPQVRNSQASNASYIGASCIGMAVATDYLQKHERLSNEDINALIVPRYQDYNDWRDWNTSPSFTTYTTIASDQGVRIRYDITNTISERYGEIEVVVNSSRRIIVPRIRIEFT
jgi:hypothetical protein